MKNGRLFQLLYLLISKKSWTAAQLAQRLEVSQRTIYRDIDALSAAGIPVYTQRGQEGGISLMEQFVLERSLLSQAEQDDILFALQSLLSTGAIENDETLLRLCALFHRNQPDWLDVDFSDWGSGTEQRLLFLSIKRAILSQKVVSFTYYSSDGRVSNRRVEPLRLRFKGGGWYLHGYCLGRQDLRLFRLSRIEHLELEDTSFLPRVAPPPSLESKSPGTPCPIKLVLRFSPQAAYRVRDIFSPNEIQAQQDGFLLVKTAFPPGRWISDFLLSFGSQVVVVAPAWIQDSLLAEAKKICQIYETGQRVSYSPRYTEEKT